MKLEGPFSSVPVSVAKVSSIGRPYECFRITAECKGAVSSIMRNGRLILPASDREATSSHLAILASLTFGTFGVEGANRLVQFCRYVICIVLCHIFILLYIIFYVNKYYYVVGMGGPH